MNDKIFKNVPLPNSWTQKSKSVAAKIAERHATEVASVAVKAVREALSSPLQREVFFLLLKRQDVNPLEAPKLAVQLVNKFNDAILKTKSKEEEML